MRRTPPISARLDDTTAELVRRNHETRLTELQSLPATSMLILSAVLPDGTDVLVQHGLGRKPLCVLVSPPRDAATPGAITETRSANYQRDKVVVLQANGFGATITVDLVVF